MNEQSVAKTPWLGHIDALVERLDVDDLPAALAAIHCRQELEKMAASSPQCCGRQALIADPAPPGSKHFRKGVCGSCGKFFGWISKPKNLARRAPSTTGIKPGVHCEICLDDEAQLEVHHVIEVQDGGGNEPGNTMTLCRGCHALVHWVRTYRGRP